MILGIQNSYSFLRGAALCSAALFSVSSCTIPPSVSNEAKTAEVWLTKGDESVKLEQQKSILFTDAAKPHQNIEINSDEKFQSVDGFGYTLTGGSVEVINRLSSDKRKALLNEIFGLGTDKISVNYIRLSIAASDLNGEVFSYDDVPAGETDINLSKFSLEKDRALLNMLKEILAINPNIKFMAAPWSPPVWMKDNDSSIGGSLKPEYYSVYANYFVKYIQEMKKEGVVIDAVTPQNEPLHPGNNPSLYMPWQQQNDFVKNHLGPAFAKAGIKTKIVLYDHNCNKPDYPINILNDPETRKFVDGSAFHLYEGDISALSSVHNVHPDKNLYFTEQWTGSKGDFKGDLNWHTKNVVIGSMRNWSKTALEWNLANDANFQPHTPGGCTECKGAITIQNPESFTRNVGYYIIAHASKFIPQNSKRISSTQTASLSTAAFETPEGKTVLIVQNGSDYTENFNIKYKGKTAETSLASNSVATYIF